MVDGGLNDQTAFLLDDLHDLLIRILSGGFGQHHVSSDLRWDLP